VPVRDRSTSGKGDNTMSQRNGKMIWIDLDNSPHVPFFTPIIKQLEERGHHVILTARDTFQVLGLADSHKLNYTTVGKHYGASKLLKVMGTVWRSVQLARVILQRRPDISISHGSRSLILLSSLLGIPTILLFDYEYAKRLPFIKPTLGIAPEALDNPQIGRQFSNGLRLYSGIKEDIYVPGFRPEPSIIQRLNLDERDIVVTIRPPANEAHYHNPESDRLFVKVVEFLGANSGVRMIILPRNEKSQKEFIYKTWPEWCQDRRIIIPDRVVDGLNLIWHSDLVISGGGTMNREAAALGVPVYSIFRGTLGAVDRYLAELGRLIMIEKVEDVNSKIHVVKRKKDFQKSIDDRLALKQIMEAIMEVIDGSKVVGNVCPWSEGKSSQQRL
jgi:uncharacterized protein